MKNKLTITVLALAFIMLGITGAFADSGDSLLFDQAINGAREGALLIAPAFSLGGSLLFDQAINGAQEGAIIAPAFGVAGALWSQSGFRVDSIPPVEQIRELKQEIFTPSGNGGAAVFKYSYKEHIRIESNLFKTSLPDSVSVWQQTIPADSALGGGSLFAQRDFGESQLRISVKKQGDSLFPSGGGYITLGGPEFSGCADTIEVRGPINTSFPTGISFAVLSSTDGLIKPQELFVPQYETFKTIKSRTQGQGISTQDLIIGLNVYSAGKGGFGLKFSESSIGSILKPEDFEVSAYLSPGAVTTKGVTFDPVSLDSLRAVGGDVGSLDIVSRYERILLDGEPHLLIEKMVRREELRDIPGATEALKTIK